MISGPRNRMIFFLLALLVFAIASYRYINSQQQQPPPPSSQPLPQPQPQLKQLETKMASETSQNPLKYLVLEPKSGKHTSTMIIVHGLGDSGHGWKSFASMLQQHPDFSQVRFIMPHAPIIRITAFGNQETPSWFNIYQLGNPNAKQDIEGFMGSVSKIESLIKSEIESKGISPSKIVLAGFSQGAALTLASAATFKDEDLKLGGFVALSGFCPIQDHIKSVFSTTNLDTPVFQAHGTSDPFISYSYGKNTGDFYEKTLGFKNFTFKTYQGLGHSTSPSEVGEVVEFLKGIF